jgi:hypothetical protein
MVWSTLLVSGDPQVVGVAARQKLAVLPKVLCASQQHRCPYSPNLMGRKSMDQGPDQRRGYLR